MGYDLSAIICKSFDTECLTKTFDKSISVHMGQGLSVIPMTEVLFDQMNGFRISDDIGHFTYLTTYVEDRILLAMGDKSFAYVEAEYFGGQGGQMGIIWEGGKRMQLLPYGQGRINQVLKYFGIVAENGHDEFETMGFGSRRHMEDWTGEEN